MLTTRHHGQHDRTAFTASAGAIGVRHTVGHLYDSTKARVAELGTLIGYFLPTPGFLFAEVQGHPRLSPLSASFGLSLLEGQIEHCCLGNCERSGRLMTRSAVQHGTMHAPRGNQRIVLLAVAGALAFAALPFVSKQVICFLGYRI